MTGCSLNHFDDATHLRMFLSQFLDTLVLIAILISILLYHRVLVNIHDVTLKL